MVVRVWSFALAIVVGSVICAGPSSAHVSGQATPPVRTLRLDWVERIGPRLRYPAMTFVVKTVTVSSAGWTVRASVMNRSHNTLVVYPTIDDLPQDVWSYVRGSTFGLLRPVPCNEGSPECAGGFHYYPHSAQRGSPALPKSLAPGKTWAGTFSSTNGELPALPKGRLVYVTFGAFYAPKIRKYFTWTTEHAFKL